MAKQQAEREDVLTKNNHMSTKNSTCHKIQKKCKSLCGCLKIPTQ